MNLQFQQASPDNDDFTTTLETRFNLAHYPKLNGPKSSIINGVLADCYNLYLAELNKLPDVDDDAVRENEQFYNILANLKQVEQHFLSLLEKTHRAVAETLRTEPQNKREIATAIMTIVDFWKNTFNTTDLLKNMKHYIEFLNTSTSTEYTDTPIRNQYAVFNATLTFLNQLSELIRKDNDAIDSNIGEFCKVLLTQLRLSLEGGEAGVSLKSYPYEERLAQMRARKAAQGR